MIDHIVVLSGFRDRPHLVLSVMAVQFQFQSILHLYDQSCRCPICTSLQTITCQIGYDNSISFLHKANLYDWSHHCPFSSLSQTAHYLINLDTSVSYSVEVTPIQSITLLSCLPFMIDCLLFKSVMIVQFRFQSRLQLYNQLCHCHVQSF